MAASYVNVDEEVQQGLRSPRDHHQHHHYQAPSPRSLRRAWSSNSSTGSGATCGHGAAPKCVCAPATHAGSFKCRLHRVNSQVGQAAPSARMPPPSSVSSSTRTVEAQ